MTRTTGAISAPANGGSPTSSTAPCDRPRDKQGNGPGRSTRKDPVCDKTALRRALTGFSCSDVRCPCSRLGHYSRPFRRIHSTLAIGHVSSVSGSQHGRPHVRHARVARRALCRLVDGPTRFMRARPYSSTKSASIFCESGRAISSSLRADFLGPQDATPLGKHYQAGPRDRAAGTAARAGCTNLAFVPRAVS
jgi:hypothetical protein